MGEGRIRVIQRDEGWDSKGEMGWEGINGMTKMKQKFMSASRGACEQRRRLVDQGSSRQQSCCRQ